MSFLRRLLNGQPARRRSLEAAGGGRRWAGDDGWMSANLNTDLAGGLATVRRRAAHYHRNNPHASRAADVLAGNVVGTGIRPQSEHPDRAMRDAIDALWRAWSQDADAAGVSDFYGLQALAVRSLVEAGEAFIRLRTRRPEDGLPVPMQLQILDAGQVDPTLHRDLAGGGRIRSGVEFDAIGRRIACHVLADAPGEFGASALAPVRVPADELVHIFEPLVPGQVRGLPWLAPVLLRLRELDAYEDAALVRAKVAALFAGFLRDPDGTASTFAGDEASGVLTSGLEPGTLKVLPPGYDIAFSEPAEAGDQYKPFVDQQLRSIAAGLGVTFEQLTGDMTGVNYSSARVALIEFRRRIEALRQHVVVHQLCRPVWRRFVETAVLAGALPAEAYETDPAAFLAVRWVAPAWEWIDPLKDTEADRLAIVTGIRTRREVIAERGRDPDQVDAEIAADLPRLAELGVIARGNAA
jgi:lambda family phage portal protein